MYKRFLFSPWFTLLFYAIAIPSSWALVKGWNRPLQPASPSAISSALSFPGGEGRLLIATPEAVFSSSPSGGNQWTTLWPITPSGTFSHLYYFPSLPDEIFVTTEKVVFNGSLETGSWKKVFALSVEDEKILSFSISLRDQKFWLCGTSAGLFESRDGGTTWAPSSIYTERRPVEDITFSGNFFYIADPETLYRSENQQAAEKIFSLPPRTNLTENFDGVISEAEEYDSQTRIRKILFNIPKVSV